MTYTVPIIYHISERLKGTGITISELDDRDWPGETFGFTKGKHLMVRRFKYGENLDNIVTEVIQELKRREKQ